MQKTLILLMLLAAVSCGGDSQAPRIAASLDDATLDLILTSDVLTNEEVCALAKGRTLSLGVGDLLSKAIKAGRHAFKLLPVAAILRRAKKAISVAENIPKEFDAAAVDAWERKLNKIVRGER